MKLFSKYSDLSDHDTTMSQTDRWTDDFRGIPGSA